MARPVEFDYDVVLENAMEQFWREGFEASSVQKLLDATGINRGTLYNSFGDKDTFFKLCVDRYNNQLGETLAATLGNKDLKAEQALQSFFDSTLGLPARQRVLGCLLVNSVCESINWDPSIQKLVRDSLNTLRKGLLARTRELEKSRALAKALKAEQAADQLLNLYTGLKVAARNGKAPKALAEQSAFGLAAVRK
jgi:TetR/AcrR family transcriptional repressor of nem operon